MLQEENSSAVFQTTPYLIVENIRTEHKYLRIKDLPTESKINHR